MRKRDIRHTIIGGRHRAQTRYYMIKGRIKSTSSKNKKYPPELEVMEQEQFVRWFQVNDFKNCSVHRLDNNQGYILSNLVLMDKIEHCRLHKYQYRQGITGTRSCTKCGVTKASALFSKDSRRWNGRASICKECDNRRGRTA